MASSAWRTDFPRSKTLTQVRYLLGTCHNHTYLCSGDADVRGDGTSGDFLERERAALGEDADFFSGNNNQQAAQVEDDDGDLLGGGDDFGAPAPQTGSKDDDINGFESAFPAIDTRNDVSLSLLSTGRQLTSLI